jgi:hypothetical protein
MARKAVPKPADLLADKLLRVLAAQRALGPDSYPLTARRLVELTDPQAPPGVVKQAVNKRAFLKAAVLARAKAADAPVALAEDLDRLAASPLTLEFLLRQAVTGTVRARTPAEIKNRATGKLQKPFQEAVARQITAGILPATVGWVLIKSPRLFLLTDLHAGRPGPGATAVSAVRETPSTAPTPSAPPVEFAAAFDTAFEHLDRQAGGHNFVSLVALRKALPLPRGAFDAGLQRLRREGRYALSAAEGRQGITPEEREAGIPEEDSLLLFVSRSSP